MSYSIGLKFLTRVLLLLFLLIVGNLNADIFYRVYILVQRSDSYLAISAFAILWVLSVLSLIAIPFIKSKLIRMISALIFSVGGGAGLFYEIISAVQMNYDNLALMVDALYFASDAISFYNSIFLVTVLYTTLHFLILYSPYEYNVLSLNKWLGLKIRWIAPVVGVTPLLLIFSLAFARGGYGTDGLANQIKIPALGMYILIDKFVSKDIKRQDVKADLEGNFKLDRPHIVLIVDESVRADFIDINKPRGLTPHLSRNKSALYNFGYSVSGSNCSEASNLILRWALSTGDFEPNQLGTSPFIWSYAANAGYNTVYIEAQVQKGRLNNHLVMNELDEINEFIYTSGNTRIGRDLDAVDELKTLVERKKPQFIYMVKSGIHFPYESSYEESESKYNPHMSGTGIVTDKKLILNSYKNAICFSIDGFFKKLFETKYENTIIIYTSDHGQNLLDNGSQLTHCSQSNSSPYEGLVPLFVIVNNESWKNEFRKAVDKNFNKTSHFNIIPTIFTIMGYSKNYIASEFPDLSVFSDLCNERAFITGVVAEPRIGLSKSTRTRWNHIKKTHLGQYNIGKITEK